MTNPKLEYIVVEERTQRRYTEVSARSPLEAVGKARRVRLKRDISLKDWISRNDEHVIEVVEESGFDKETFQ